MNRIFNQSKLQTNSDMYKVLQSSTCLFWLAALAVNALPQTLNGSSTITPNGTQPSTSSSTPEFKDYPNFNSPADPLPAGSYIQCENTIDKTLNYSASGYFTLRDVEAAVPPFCTSTYFFQLPDPSHAFLGIGGYLNDLAIIIQSFDSNQINTGPGVFNYSDFAPDCADAFTSLITWCLEIQGNVDALDAPQRGGSLFWRDLQFSLRFNGDLNLALPSPATGGYVEVNWTTPIPIQTPVAVSAITASVFEVPVTTVVSSSTISGSNGQQEIVVPVYNSGTETVTISVPSSELTVSPSAPPNASASPSPSASPNPSASPTNTRK